jgi:diguanylate cyclase (GGDEF)-like protein
MYNHGQWYKELIRSIVCQLSPDQRELDDEAYRYCRFGQWYYNGISEDLHNHPSYLAIETEHILMHKLANKLLIASSNGQPVSPMDYDNFSNALERLRLNIDFLKHEIEETLYNRDPLTGIRNRVTMLSDLWKMHELVKRHVQDVTIAIMDIDHFKVINDTYGHPIGDKVLTAVAQFVMAHIRPYDKVYRYGGEEFLICMPGTDIQTANIIINRLREELSLFTAVSLDNDSINVKASFGLSILDEDTTVDDSIEKADEALYASKKSGRNMVSVWNNTMHNEMV